MPCEGPGLSDDDAPLDEDENGGSSSHTATPRSTQQSSAQPTPMGTTDSNRSQESTLSNQPIKRRRVQGSVRSRFVIDKADDEDDDDEDENEDEKSVRNSLEDPYHIPIDTQLHVSSSRQDDAAFIDDSPLDENHSQGDPPPYTGNYCMMVLDEDEDGNETRCL